MKKLISKTIYNFINLGIKKFVINGVTVTMDEYCNFTCKKGVKVGVYQPKENDTVKKVANALAAIIVEIL